MAAMRPCGYHKLVLVRVEHAAATLQAMWVPQGVKRQRVERGPPTFEAIFDSMLEETPWQLSLNSGSTAAVSHRRCLISSDYFTNWGTEHISWTSVLGSPFTAPAKDIVGSEATGVPGTWIPPDFAPEMIEFYEHVASLKGTGEGLHWNRYAFDSQTGTL